MQGIGNCLSEAKVAGFRDELHNDKKVKGSFSPVRMESLPTCKTFHAISEIKAKTRCFSRLHLALAELYPYLSSLSFTTYRKVETMKNRLGEGERNRRWV